MPEGIDRNVVMLQVHDLYVGYYKDLYILQGINVVARRARITTVLGANGVGKSTLLKAVYGFLPPAAGDVVLDGRSLIGWDPRTGRERPYPLPGADSIHFVQLAASPAGRWLLLQAGSLGQQFYRLSRVKAGAMPELVYEAPHGQTLGRCGIDDDGRVYVSPRTWTGELYAIRPAPGHSF